MYTWADEMDDWARPGAYSYSSARRAERAREASMAEAAGPRSYNHEAREPQMALVDPKKRIVSQSTTPLLIAVDVTGSMAHWPFEIFDRLPLLYNTLSQYRSDLDLCFGAIGDAAYDRWPLQVTRFCRGFALEDQLRAIYGEGGGGDEPESYELFAQFVDTHVGVTCEEKPFLIVFGDAHMKPKVRRAQVQHVLGDGLQKDLDAIEVWKKVAQRWNVWFLRRQGKRGDSIDEQWGKAIGKQHIVHIQDEQRAVDYAMGLVARAWGHYDDFRVNMAARQDESQIRRLETQLDEHLPLRTRLIA